MGPRDLYYYSAAISEEVSGDGGVPSLYAAFFKMQRPHDHEKELKGSVLVGKEHDE